MFGDERLMLDAAIRLEILESAARFVCFLGTAARPCMTLSATGRGRSGRAP